MRQRFDQIVSLLSSKQLALFLFLGLAAFLIPETFTPSLPFYKTVRFALVALLALNLIFCTLFRFKAIRKTTVIIHLGCFVTIIGSLIGHFGYVATINIYEGGTSRTAFRWDKQLDFPLGFQLRVLEIGQEYYPVPVKVGVLENGIKKELFQLKTGESFVWKNYTIQANNIDLQERSLRLTIFDNEKQLGTYNTSQTKGIKNLPFDLKLVAFQDPNLKRVRVNIEILTGEDRIQGVAEVNHPFSWKGIRFFNTSHGIDPTGAPYAGIQIVKDPGIPLVYLGFMLILLGAFFHLWHHYRARQ